MKLLLLLILPLMAFSTVKTNTGFHGGLTIGFNKLRYSGKSLSLRSDYSVGVFNAVTVKKFIFLSEVLFSQRGVTATYKPQNKAVRMMFMDFNALPGIKIKNLFLAAGISMAVNLRTTLVVDKEFENNKFRLDSYPIDVGNIFAIGFVIPLVNSKSSFVVQGRFSQYYMSSTLTKNLRQVSILIGIVF